MTSGRAFITTRADGAVTHQGVYAGTLTVHYRTHTMLVLKAASHSYWAGLHAERGTMPTWFYVYEITSETEAPGGATEFVCQAVCDFPLRKQA